jgi:protein SCO1/2
MRRFLIFLLLVLLAGCNKPVATFHGTDIAEMYTKADFHLIDHNGKARTLADFRGKAVVLFFGYTHCPDICSTTMLDLAQVIKLLGSDADKVQVLFVTIDPERDKPEKLAAFVKGHHPSFLGLYGDNQATEQATKAFFVGSKKEITTSGYNMDHSVEEFLVDPQGRVRLLEPYSQRVDWLAEDIRLLLAGN